MDPCQRCGAPGRVELHHPVHHLDATYCEHCMREVGAERTAAKWVVKDRLPAPAASIP